MANNYTKILELANKNNMGLSNTIKRDYGIPLDYSSVQETYDAALAYAKTSTLAYIGQPISVGDTLYIVTDEANGYLKAVGTKPTGDNGSIIIGEDGTVAIYGFTAAPNATLPRKKADGTLEWVAIDAIVSGDGNTKTLVKAADDSDITVTDDYDADNDTHTYTLDVQFPAIPEYSVSKEDGTASVTYKLTKDGTAVGESIIVPKAYDDTALASRVTSAEAAISSHDGRISDVEERVETFFGAVENPDEVIDTLAEIQKYITDDKTGANGMLSSIKANTQAIETLNGTGVDSVKGQISSAINKKAAEDAGKYATQDALAAVSATANAAAVKADVDTALAGKVDKATLDNYYTTTQTYTRDEIDELLNDVTGGSQETAASVKRQLDTHEAENTAKFSEIDTKDGNQDTAIQANTDAITAINDAETGILAKAKADAQAKVKALEDGKVAENTSAIGAVDAKVNTTNSNVTAVTERVAALETSNGQLDAAIKANTSAHTTLAETVAEHTQSITELKDKDIELAAAIAANTGKFDNYSTTAQVNKAIDDKIAAIDSTAINNAVSANTEAIQAEVTRAQNKEAELAQSISANTTAIAGNTSDIAALEAAINAVIENDDGEALSSIKELAAWISDHETEVLPTINANTQAIATLNGDGEGSVKKTVADAIKEIPIATALVAGLVKASDEISVASDGAMSIVSISTDKLVQGNNVLILNGGKAVEKAAE